MLERFFFFGISPIPSFGFNCNHWWVILALSLLCTLLYFLLFIDVVIELHKIQHHHEMICKKLAEISQQILAAKGQDGVGLSLEDGGEFGDYGFELSFHEKILLLEKFRIGWRKVFIYFSACVLLAVTAVDLYACKYLLCS
ncbi:unnamed protein product [Citrullus colocynthis]|uniref:Uncharacterized protein n=1 Tax=Citrullus colocynthis TaxID=252529 RepID=A0ABP0XW43_9ROSI